MESVAKPRRGTARPGAAWHGTAWRGVAQMLDLKDFIYDHTDFTVKGEGDALRILEDEEASLYNEHRDRSLIRQMARVLDRNLRVDVRNLSPERTGIHERNLIKQSKGLAALRQARRLPSTRPVERTVPGLPGKT